MGATHGGEIWLDLSRTLWRVSRGTLTGIDRVETAYAEHLPGLAGERIRYVAFNPISRRFRFLDSDRVEALVRRIGPGWRDGSLDRLSREALCILLRSATGPGPGRAARQRPRPTYLNVSGQALHRAPALGRMLAATGAAFVPLVHDLIPLAHPEYVRPVAIDMHRRRIAAISELASGVIANSRTTAATLEPHLVRGTPLLAAPLGVRHIPAAPPAAPGDRPYFVCLGTIEPRKNHITLLHVWRRLAAEAVDTAPRLLVVGRRGWENENVLNFLERCAAIRPLVSETGALPDAEVARLLDGARALLMPSFAEGYGLPVAEAIARGTPVICSDIAAHREVGGDVPDFLDPLDALAWCRAAVDYASPASPRRAAQLGRLRGWRATSWEDHVRGALAFVDGVAAGCPVDKDRRGSFPQS